VREEEKKKERKKERKKKEGEMISSVIYPKLYDEEPWIWFINPQTAQRDSQPAIFWSSYHLYQYLFPLSWLS
jgi:hypothetical protein